MDKFRNPADALGRYNSPDIIEDLGNVIYQGYFQVGTDETEENNCLIIKIETVGTTSKRTFAEGVNYECSKTWNNRKNYNYSFGLKNI